jgi:hypothetical protein
MATRLPLLKREERRFDEQYFKGVGTGASLGTTIMPGIGTAIGAGVGAVVGVISGLFKSKEKKPEHLLVNKIECLHLQHLLREEQTSW